jgi:hypothetical protein
MLQTQADSWVYRRSGSIRDRLQGNLRLVVEFLLQFFHHSEEAAHHLFHRGQGTIEFRLVGNAGILLPGRQHVEPLLKLFHARRQVREAFLERPALIGGQPADKLAGLSVQIDISPVRVSSRTNPFSVLSSV